MFDVYDGIREFKRRDGVIIKMSYPSLMGGLSRTISGKTFMFVNPDYSLEENVKTMIHEFLHLSPKYLPYFGTIGGSVEDCIDADMEQVYVNSPFLVNYLKKKYSEAPLYS